MRPPAPKALQLAPDGGKRADHHQFAVRLKCRPINRVVRIRVEPGIHRSVKTQSCQPVAYQAGGTGEAARNDRFAVC